MAFSSLFQSCIFRVIFGKYLIPLSIQTITTDVYDVQLYFTCTLFIAKTLKSASLIGKSVIGIVSLFPRPVNLLCLLKLSVQFLNIYFA